MALNSRVKSLFVVAGIALACLLAAGEMSSAQSPSLIVRINDTTASPEGTGSISVYMTNYVDSVAGFTLWLQLNRPDLITLQLDSSNFVHVDTSGTAISGWQYVQGRSLGTAGYDVKVIALVNLYPQPVQASLAPSAQERLLLRIPFTVQSVLDTLTERTALVMIQGSLEHTGFSRNDGSLIGLAYNYVLDSNMYLCTQRLPDNTCLNWMRVMAPPYDSVFYFTDTIPYLDTNEVKYSDGTVTITNCYGGYVPADVDLDGNPRTIADLTMLLRFIADGTPPLPDPRTADLNGDCFIDMADGKLLADWFQYGGSIQFADCTCPNPVWRCCSGMRGNIDRDPDDVVDVSDLTALVEFLFGTNGTLVCPEAANVDGDPDNTVDVSDLTALTDYLFNNGIAPGPCQ
jgi:hypothetical protein